MTLIFRGHWEAGTLPVNATVAGALNTALLDPRMGLSPRLIGACCQLVLSVLSRPGELGQIPASALTSPTLGI